MRYLIVFLGVLVGCATSNNKTGEATALREVLFPQGTYHHGVNLDIVGADSQEFDGYVQLKKEGLSLKVLSPMGMTLLAIDDDFSQKEPKVDIFFESLKKMKPQILEYYTAIKGVMLLKKKDQQISKKNRLGFPLTMKSQKGWEAIFNDYDKNHIPQKMQVKHPRFKALVKVVSYDI